MKQLLIFVIVVASAIFTGCRNDDYETTPKEQTGRLILNIKHTVDGKSLVWNDIVYKNAAGNAYSVTRLQYYLSSFRFYYKNKIVYKADSIFYIDAQDATSLLLPGIKPMQFDSIAFLIGLGTQYNISYGLPATDENIGMNWPDAMGGGYHFLKLEGYWKEASEIAGFAMHLGKNGYQVSAGVYCGLKTITQIETSLPLNMNINEWFRRPYVYDFSKDGVYSMGNAKLMKKIAENGTDVFAIKN